MKKDENQIGNASSCAAPDFFELHIPTKDQIIQSKLAWIDNCEAGVSFVSIAASRTPFRNDGELAVRLVRLEDEITALKQMLKHLQKQVDVYSQERVVKETDASPAAAHHLDLGGQFPAADRLNVRESLFAEAFNRLLQQNRHTSDVAYTNERRRQLSSFYSGVFSSLEKICL